MAHFPVRNHVCLYLTSRGAPRSISSGLRVRLRGLAGRGRRAPSRTGALSISAPYKGEAAAWLRPLGFPSLPACPRDGAEVELHANLFWGMFKKRAGSF